MSENLSIEQLEKEVLVHLAHDRQELIDLVYNLAESIEPLVIDDDFIEVRMSHSLYESLFSTLESLGFIETEIDS